MARTRHPHPDVLADHLEAVARRVRNLGPQAITTANTLAARGYPTTTLGNGARTTTDNTSTERAALNPDPWADIDEDLAHAYLNAFRTTLNLDSLIARLLAHAPDDDPIPAGRGHCQACETFCRGDGGNDRLRSGLCHACTTALTRWRPAHPLGARSDFIRHRRQQLGMPDAVGA